MTTRARPSRGERRSWREQDAPLSRPLLYYRRMVATLACLLLIGLFIALIWWFWPRSETWTSKHLFIADYDRDSAAPLLPAATDKQSLARMFPFSSDVVQAATDAARLSDALEKLAKNTDGGQGKGPLLVYVAGHGCSIGNEAFIYASDFSPEKSQLPGISVKDLLAAVARHPARQTLLIVDSGPIEHDLRVGTAVNRFPEILRVEFENSEQLKLGSEEELIVLSSHQVWERSFVSPKENRSVFGFYVAEALTSPDANADKLRFDGQKPDGKITLAEWVAQVQRGVSAWVWQASNHTRTQRPMLLYARGTQRQQVDLVHEPKPGVSQPAGTGVATRLDAIVLPNLIGKPAGNAVALVMPFETSAHAQDAPPSTPATAPNDRAAADSDKGAAETAKTSAAKPDAAAKAAPPAPDLRPDWLKSQAALVNSSFGTLSATGGNWTASDYDPLQVRRRMRDMLYVQQLQLGGQAGSFTSGDDHLPPQWHPLPDWQQQNATTLAGLRDAARLRNAALLKLGAYIEALDAAEMLAFADRTLLDELQSQWQAVLRATTELNESLEQEEYVDIRASEGQTIDDHWSLQNEPSNVAEIQARGRRTADACHALEQKVLALLLSQAPLPISPQHAASWLPRWDLAQSVPIALWDRTDLPDFKKDGAIPPLGFAGDENAADGQSASKEQSAARTMAISQPILPTSSEVDDEVNLASQQRRTRWLARHTALANLLPAGKDSASPIASQGDNAQELNETALEIAERHKQSVAWLTSALAATPSALTDWRADRVLRLAQRVDAEGLRPKRDPLPLNLVKRTQQRFLLRLEGPTDVIPLALGKEQEVQWKIRRGGDGSLSLARARVALAFDDALSVTHSVKGQIRPGEFSLQELVDEQGDSFRFKVSPRREMDASEVINRDLTIKPVSVVLSLDAAATSKRQARSTAGFQLPAAPVLDVVVTGYAGTMQLAGGESLAGSGAGQQFRLNPPPSAAEDGGNTARSHVSWRLRPMPQGETRYQLAVVNRSLVPREVVANWHVLEGQQPVTDWQTMERQIGDSRPKLRSKPTRLEPGKPWVIPLFPEPVMPAAGAAAPTPMPDSKPPDPLQVENGLVCKLTDVNDEQWVQWIWITARPRQPATYVLADPKYVLSGAGGTVETRLRAAPESIDLLPTGRKTLVQGNPGGWEGSRVVFSKKEVKEDLATTPVPITAEIPPASTANAGLLPFSLDVDGYPRALRFMVDNGARQAAEDRSAGLYLRLLQLAEPPMPGKEDLPLARSTLYFQKAPKLRYELQAEFPRDAARYAVRLMRDDSVSERLQTFYFDRDFQIECRHLPPEDAAKWNLALTCGIRELRGELDWLTPDDYPPPRRLKLRAEIVAIDASGDQQPLKPPVQDELAIVLDNDPPTITQRPAAMLDWRKTDPPQRLPVIDFAVGDGEEEDGASGIAEVMWGTMRKGESDLQDGKPLELPPGRPGTATKLRIAVPQSAMPQEGKSVEILILARDRAGNVLGPEKLQTINVTLPKRKIDNPKGSDKAPR